jgi:hypothetical protein
MRRALRGRYGRLLGSGLAVLLLLVPLGCSGKGSVSGKVLYKGEPLKGGTVTFVPDGEGKQSVRSNIEEDGTYTIIGVAPGPAKIMVETRSAKPTTGLPPMMAPGGKSPFPANDPNSARREAASKDRYVNIPAKYEKTETSGLSYTVTSGKQTFDVKLD